MMFTILAYDVNENRVDKLRKIVCKYMIPVQRSLFQGFLTERQMLLLKQEISRTVDPDEDRVIFYKIVDNSVLEMEELGAGIEQEMIL